MPLSSRTRAVSLLLALLSMVALDDTSRAACAMHGVGAMASGIGGAADQIMSAPAGASEHEHQGAENEQSPENCHCSCIGDCTGTAPLASITATPTLRVAIADAQPRRLFDVLPVGAEPTEPDRLLPFANGPPATLTL